MILNQKYNFPEAKLGPNFAQDKLKEFKQLIDVGLSFVVLSMPGVGVSFFLKYLAMQKFAFFIHVDLYLLPILSQHEFYKLLLTEVGGNPKSKPDNQLLQETKEILRKLSEKREKIVIIFSRFDQLKAKFDSNFLSNIQSLTTVSPDKIALIFTSIKPLHEIAPGALSGGNLNFYSENLYFKPYSKDDLTRLLKIEPARPGLAKPALEKLLNLSGGHNQLLHILLSSQKQQSLLLDQFVKLQMKGFVDYLNYHQRKQVQKIALGKQIDEVDDYLLGVGIVRQSTSEVKKMRLHLGGATYELFTTLLSEYIKTNLPVKLPVKESKLFKLLRQNMGRTVSKDEIFNVVWDPASAGEGATDWALDALIYRLRKHPFIQANGYIIESQKKVGYTLIQT